MLTKVKELTGVIGINKLLLVIIVMGCVLTVIVSFLTGNKDDPLAIMSEDIIEDIVAEETGIKLDINNNGK